VAESNDRLRQSEKRLSISQRVAKVGTAEMHMRTGYVLWTDIMYRVHGAEPGEIEVREATLQFIHPDDRDRVTAALNQRIVQMNSCSSTIRFLGVDGKIRHLQDGGCPGI
jgi:PAS domain-containing protein